MLPLILSTREVRIIQIDSSGNTGYLLGSNLKSIQVFFWKQFIDSFCDSEILAGMSQYHDQLIKWLPKNTEWDVCYRASRDGWAANIFHNRCNDKGPTITIIRAGQYIFGGYTEASWARNGKLL